MTGRLAPRFHDDKDEYHDDKDAIDGETTAPSGPHNTDYADTDLLDGMELFAGLDRALRRRLVASALARRIRSRTLLFHRGEPGDSLFLLCSGLVEVFRLSATGRRATITVVQAPGVFGEEALTGCSPRVASAMALRDSFVLSLSGPDIRRLSLDHMEMQEAILRWLCVLIERRTDQQADQQLLDLPGRVAKVLTRMADLAGPGPTVLDLPQEVIAGLASGSRQSVNHTLRQFVDRGWLRIESRRITITDLPALGHRAGLSSTTATDRSRSIR